MASFDYCLNPLYLIKECSSYGALYTTNYCCSDRSLRDKIICDLDKTPDLSPRPPQNCPKCGNPVDGQYCQGCALPRKKFKEDLFTYCIENRILQASSELSNDNTNVVNAFKSYSLSIKTPEEEKQIEEEQAAKVRYWKILVCYDDDDEDYTIAITHKEPDNFLNCSLFDEFAGELTLLKSIPPGINETDYDRKEETHFIKRLLYDKSSPRPPEEFISENSDTAIESFSLFPIPVEDSDSLMEETDLSFTPNDLMSLRIEEYDYDSERDILILEELLSNDSLSLPENKSFHFDIPSSSCPLAKPSDGNT
nr:hypothetical protein [Tanacetum cinerariifolium]